MRSNGSHDKVINNIYHGPAGYGSITSTFKEAFQKDKTITLNDVKPWFKSNLESTKQVKGNNSVVAPYPYSEYQLDLMFFHKFKTSKNLNKVCYVLISLLSMPLLFQSKLNKKMT